MRNFLSSEFCELVFGVNKFDLDLGFQIDSVKQPIKSNPVGAGHVSHRWTSSFNYQFDHGFIVFKNVQLRLILRRLCVCGYIIHITQLLNLLFSFDIRGLGLGMQSRTSFLDAGMFVVDRNTLITMSQKS